MYLLLLFSVDRLRQGIDEVASAFIQRQNVIGVEDVLGQFSV